MLIELQIFIIVFIIVELDKVEAIIVLANAFHEQDDYYFANLLISAMYTMQYWVYAIAVVSVILAIVCFVFLMCASGRRNGLAAPQPGWGTKIPLDLLVAGAGLGAFIAMQFWYEAMY